MCASPQRIINFTFNTLLIVSILMYAKWGSEPTLIMMLLLLLISSAGLRYNWPGSDILWLKKPWTKLLYWKEVLALKLDEIYE